MPSPVDSDAPEIESVAELVPMSDVIEIYEIVGIARGVFASNALLYVNVNFNDPLFKNYIEYNDCAFESTVDCNAD